MARPRKVAEVAKAAETVEQIDVRIRKVFAVMSKVAKGVTLGHIKAAIVSGAPGCGKSHTLERDLEYAEAMGKVKFDSIKGACSAIGLYRKLWENCEPGSVLLIDDCDDVFADESCMNLLKVALDTGKSRKVHWNKESRVLNEEDIPRSFEFKGAVIFITNKDFVREIAKQNKLAPHFEALLSRTLYVDLGIHSKREILVRIGQVVHEDEFLDANEITPKQADEMMKWLTSNVNELRVLSIRTVLQLTNMLKTDGCWREMAEVLMLNNMR